MRSPIRKFGRSNTRFIRTAAGVLSVGALALLAGCASGADSSSASDGLTPVTLQAAWVNDAEFMGYFIGIDEGYYEEEGINLSYLSGGPSVIPETVLLSGDADIILTSPETTISGIDKGADFVIIGAQYQQSPLGIVSLEESDITGPKDLVGKTVAVPDGNRITFSAMLAINDIDESDVTVVPYTFDPTPLVNGEVDATVDFVTNVPYTIGELGYETNYFTFYEAGFTLPNDVVVVQRSYLENNRDLILGWYRATLQGWVTNFEDVNAYPAQFENTWFKGTGRTIANEEFFNKVQQPLIESKTGMFRLTDEAIQQTLDTLALVGIEGSFDSFDMSLFEDLEQ